MSLERELRAQFGPAVLEGAPADYLTDFTRLPGRADAVVLPESAEQVAAVLAWCYERDVAIVPRGGGTGASAGAVPDGGVVLALDRLDRVRSFEPELWRIHVEAGVPTGRLKQLVRESGLMFAPDPGAPEQSQIGGNVATNAGGPHAFKYGVVADWVTGLEAAIPPGELVSVGGAIRKDVAGYDLKRPARRIGGHARDRHLGVAEAAARARGRAPGRDLPPRDREGLRGARAGGRQRDPGGGAGARRRDPRLGRASFPGCAPDGAGFVLLAEADGSGDEAERIRAEVVEAAGEGALGVYALVTGRASTRCGAGAPACLLGAGAPRRRRRRGHRRPARPRRGGDARDRRDRPRHGLVGLSFGHAGDGNLHSAFLVDPGDPDELSRVEVAVEELFELAIQLGGSVSGEHGLGLLKRGRLARQWSPRALDLHEQIKHVFDPKNLLNPGKKLARPVPGDRKMIATRS